MRDWEKFEAVIPFELKSLKETDEFYEFKGYASIFNIPDRINDIVDPGAFKRTIDHHKGVFPLAWMHNREEIIGSTKVYEDGKGLRVEPGRLVKGIQRAEDVYRLMKAEVVDGMSFSFRTIQRAFQGKFRHLKELAVGELTLGPSSMICHPGALVTDVKLLSAGMILDNHLDRLREIVGTKLWEDKEDWTEIRYRLQEHGGFTRIRSWSIKANSIRAIGGPLKSTGKTAIQALRFLKSAGWTLSKAKTWVREHPDIKTYEITAGLSYAISQHDIKIESA